jgi:hypothetical protein
MVGSLYFSKKLGEHCFLFRYFSPLTGSPGSWAPGVPFEAGDIWLQTTGASLLAVPRCSPRHVRTPVQDSRSAHGLLYLAAVQNDSHHLIRRNLHASPGPVCMWACLRRLAQHCASFVAVERPRKAKIRPLELPAFWLQTNGTPLHAVKRCSRVPVPMACAQFAFRSH